MPAKSEKQANLFRAALGDPAAGTAAAKIKASLSKDKIKHFTHVGEGTAETLGLTSEEAKSEKLKSIIRKLVAEVISEIQSR